MVPPPAVTVSAEARIAATYSRLMTGIDPSSPPSSSSGGERDNGSVVQNHGASYPASPQMMQYWSRVIRSGRKSMRDFEASVLQSDEYALRVRERFEAAWRRTLGVDVPFDIDALPTCRAYVASIVDAADAAGSPPSSFRPAFLPEAQVEREVRNTPQFSRKYSEVVRSRAFLLQEDAAAAFSSSSSASASSCSSSVPVDPTTSWQLTPPDLEAFVEKFRNDSTYDTARLEDELRELVSSRSSPPPPPQQDNSRSRSRSSSRAPTTDDSVCAHEEERRRSTDDDSTARADDVSPPAPSTSSPPTLPPLSPSLPSPSPPPPPPPPLPSWQDRDDMVRRVLREFVAVFGRPMFVQEFLRYCGRRRPQRRAATTTTSNTDAPPLPPPPDKTAFERDLARLRRLANVVRGVHGRFTGHAASDYEIVDEWLHLIDERRDNEDAAAKTAGGKTTKTTATESGGMETMLSPEEIDARVADSVVRSDMYERAMRAKIDATQRESRGGVNGGNDGGGLSSSYDIDCLFEVARRRRLDLVGEELREAVRAYGVQGARLGDNITGVYAAVLDRFPDAEELHTTLCSYREHLKRAAALEGQKQQQQQQQKRDSAARSSRGGVGVFVCWQGSMEDELGGGSGGGVDDEEEAWAEQPLVTELNDALERRLVADLEFHDVLKRRIGRAWEHAHAHRHGHARHPPLPGGSGGGPRRGRNDRRDRRREEDEIGGGEEGEGQAHILVDMIDGDSSGYSGDYLLAPLPPPRAGEGDAAVSPPRFCSSPSPSSSSPGADADAATQATKTVPTLSGRLLYDTLRAVLRELERAPAAGTDDGKPASLTTALSVADRVASERFATSLSLQSRG